MPTSSTKTTKKVAKTVASVAKPRRRATTSSASPTHDQIAERAYYLSLDGGGDDMGNWLRAEQELTG